jgi:hypothetical protein
MIYFPSVFPAFLFFLLCSNASSQRLRLYSSPKGVRHRQMKTTAAVTLSPPSETTSRALLEEEKERQDLSVLMNQNPLLIMRMSNTTSSTERSCVGQTCAWSMQSTRATMPEASSVSTVNPVTGAPTTQGQNTTTAGQNNRIGKDGVAKPITTDQTSPVAGFLKLIELLALVIGAATAVVVAVVLMARLKRSTVVDARDSSSTYLQFEPDISL